MVIWVEGRMDGEMKTIYVSTYLNVRMITLDWHNLNYKFLYVQIS